MVSKASKKTPKSSTHGTGVQVPEKKKKKNVRLDQVLCAGAHPLSYLFKPARVNPIKLAYDRRQPDGRSHGDQRL